eukprot:COSAG05_NODE_5319_length_1208_cov_1.908025_1_plen_57_part_01
MDIVPRPPRHHQQHHQYNNKDIQTAIGTPHSAVAAVAVTHVVLRLVFLDDDELTDH